MARHRYFTVTGPGVEKPCPDGPGVALSAAITFASQRARVREEATFYVRDADGNSVGYAAADADGLVIVRSYLAGAHG